MILDDIVADKKVRLVEHKSRISEEKMKELGSESDRKCFSFYDGLKKEGLSIIGEFKKASPSMGVIADKIDLTDRIDQYNQSVNCISVLTEEDHFNGNVDYLKKVRGITNLPIIRKDFIIDEYQIYEAKYIGADCILLIVAILTDEELDRFYKLATKLGLDVLVETHDESEMLRAVNIGAKIIGINNRNLKDFVISLNTTERLSKYMDELLAQKGIKERPVLVSESGVLSDDDIRFLKKSNVDAMLIGRALMESEKPMEVANHWREVFNEG